MIVVYSLSILILILLIVITLAILSPEGKTLVEKDRLNVLVVCNEISFFNNFSVFVGNY